MLRILFIHRQNYVYPCVCQSLLYAYVLVCACIIHQTHSCVQIFAYFNFCIKCLFSAFGRFASGILIETKIQIKVYDHSHLFHSHKAGIMQKCRYLQIFVRTFVYVCVFGLFVLSQENSILCKNCLNVCNCTKLFAL